MLYLTDELLGAVLSGQCKLHGRTHVICVTPIRWYVTMHDVCDLLHVAEQGKVGRGMRELGSTKALVGQHLATGQSEAV